MADVTITELSLTDMPQTPIVGTPRRKQMFFLTGTASAVTSAFNLKTYVPVFSTLDSVSIIMPPVYQLITFSATGTASAGTALVTGTYFTSAGTIVPGTAGPFGLTGVIAL